MLFSINESIVRKLLTTVDAGLSHGLGNQKPGEMCVEAAVCYALGLPHGDDPKCVAQSLRSLKIALNDSSWSSKEARAKGLRRLAVIQLGSKDNLDEILFAKKISEFTIKAIIPVALRLAAKMHPQQKHKNALEQAALKCEKESTTSAASDVASDAASAASAASDKILNDFSEGIVQILIGMKVPGAAWLYLTEQ